METTEPTFSLRFDRILLSQFSQLGADILEQVVETTPTELHISYPLETAFTRTLAIPSPTTVSYLLAEIDHAYQEIYRVEEASHVPLLPPIQCTECFPQLNLYEYKFNFDRYDESMCVVCFSKRMSSKIILDCGHKFHFHCICKWCLKKNECPLCKTPIIKCDACKSRRSISLWELSYGGERREPTFGQYGIGPIHYEELQIYGLIIRNGTLFPLIEAAVDTEDTTIFIELL